MDIKWYYKNIDNFGFTIGFKNTMPMYYAIFDKGQSHKSNWKNIVNCNFLSDNGTQLILHKLIPISNIQHTIFNMFIYDKYSLFGLSIYSSSDISLNIYDFINNKYDVLHKLYKFINIYQEVDNFTLNNKERFKQLSTSEKDNSWMLLMSESKDNVQLAYELIK